MTPKKLKADNELLAAKNSAIEARIFSAEQLIKMIANHDIPMEAIKSAAKDHLQYAESEYNKKMHIAKRIIEQ